MRTRWRNALLLVIVLGAGAASTCYLLGGDKVWDVVREIPGISRPVGDGKGASAQRTPAVGATVIPADEPMVVEGISWFATPRPTSTPEPAIAIVVEKQEAAVNAGVLNLRAGPSTVHAVLGRVKRGDKLEIVGRNGAGDWLQVVAPDGTEAWIYGQLVTTGADLDDLPVTDAFSVPPPVE